MQTWFEYWVLLKGWLYPLHQSLKYQRDMQKYPYPIFYVLHTQSLGRYRAPKLWQWSCVTYIFHPFHYLLEPSHQRGYLPFSLRRKDQLSGGIVIRFGPWQNIWEWNLLWSALSPPPPPSQDTTWTLPVVSFKLDRLEIPLQCCTLGTGVTLIGPFNFTLFY